RLHLLREQLHAVPANSPCVVSHGLTSECLNVQFDNVGKLNQRADLFVVDEIVQRDRIPALDEVRKPVVQSIVDHRVRCNFEHDPVLRQSSAVLAKHEITRDVNKCKMRSNNLLEADIQERIE